MKKYTFLFCYLFIISCSLFAQNKVIIGVMSETKSIASDTLFPIKKIRIIADDYLSNSLPLASHLTEFIEYINDLKLPNYKSI
ncbi:hypothetical protein [Flammeovirga kamogawensis]|uniref:Uncharacterized protein n=1 Tax=Flammeovirga kamogawensis TaxID=373891 RepID=A0ABX8H0N0_9BACT|nr:hypothetical protein [Flammeovirga kamogawensis]MBB6462213.1 hypothetical protein [Flammeovirga kamogawensis]QWG09386.1 hypothetical protein KM029_22530 [Flammeovirga kamogawensis]TRX64904.1 hypothetical protein EO216_20440 [Flammeovirga kamogawensis]